MKKCLGFWDANSEICDWEDEAGTKPILEIKMRKTFPCVPVSELKKAIKTVLERLWEEEKEDHCDMKSDWVQTWFLELEKELGLSKKTKPESDSSESLVKNRRLI